MWKKETQEKAEKLTLRVKCISVKGLLIERRELHESTAQN